MGWGVTKYLPWPRSIRWAAVKILRIIGHQINFPQDYEWRQLSWCCKRNKSSKAGRIVFFSISKTQFEWEITALKVRCHGLGGNQAWMRGDDRSLRHRWCLPMNLNQQMYLQLSSVSGKCLASEPGLESPFLEPCSGAARQRWQLGGSLAWSSGDQWRFEAFIVAWFSNVEFQTVKMMPQWEIKLCDHKLEPSMRGN